MVKMESLIRFKMKLIKLSESHYIVVDDSEIKMGDFYWTPIKRSIEQCVKKLLIIKGGQNDIEQFKITHSTQALEQSKSISNNCGIVEPNVFINIKPFSLLEVEELIYGYSAEKMADEVIKKEGSIYKDAIIGKSKWIEGFNAHRQLVKDKLFTDIKNLFESYGDNFAAKKIWEDAQDVINPTEWEVTFDEKGKLKLIN